MKEIREAFLFQCPLCKELSHLESFQTSTHGLEVFCSLCSETFFYPVKRKQEENPQNNEEPTSKKPPTLQSKPLQSKIDMMTHTPDESSLEGQWEGILSAWQNQTLHDNFLSHCIVTEQYEIAGKLYRQAQEHEEYRELATKQLEKLTELAHIQILKKFQGDPTQSKLSLSRVRLFWLSILLLGVVSTFVLCYFYFQNLFKTLR